MENQTFDISLFIRTISEYYPRKAILKLSEQVFEGMKFSLKFGSSIKNIIKQKSELDDEILEKLKIDEDMITQGSILFREDILPSLNNKSDLLERLYSLFMDSEFTTSREKKKAKEYFEEKRESEPELLFSYLFISSLSQPNIDYINNLDKLEKRGIDLLASKVEPAKERLIRAKFNNISGKTGRYFVPDTLFQKRTPRKNRTLIPFTHVKESKLSMEDLKGFEGGVAVEFVNGEFFDEFEKAENARKQIFNCLFEEMFEKDEEKLTLKENKGPVTAIIDIRTEGKSDSNKQREALSKLANFLEMYGLLDNPESQIIRNQDSEVIEIKDNKEKPKIFIQRNDAGLSGKKNGIGIGNDKWQGFVYYRISGGQQDSYDSHEQNKISDKKVMLFNPSVEYACSSVSIDITLTLIYFAFFSIAKDDRDRKWQTTRLLFEKYLQSQTYDGVNLYDYVNNHISLNIEKGVLSDPIQGKEIQISDFCLSDRNEDSLDITHQSSVKNARYSYDENRKTILTPAQPTNLFWSKHLSNMMQQNFSLEEYFKQQVELVDKWKANEAYKSFLDNHTI